MCVFVCLRIDDFFFLFILPYMAVRVRNCEKIFVVDSILRSTIFNVISSPSRTIHHNLDNNNKKEASIWKEGILRFWRLFADLVKILLWRKSMGRRAFYFPSAVIRDWCCVSTADRRVDSCRKRTRLSHQVYQTGTTHHCSFFIFSWGSPFSTLCFGWDRAKEKWKTH